MNPAVWNVALKESPGLRGVFGAEMPVICAEAGWIKVLLKKAAKRMDNGAMTLRMDMVRIRIVLVEGWDATERRCRYLREGRFHGYLSP